MSEFCSGDEFLGAVYVSVIAGVPASALETLLSEGAAELGPAIVAGALNTDHHGKLCLNEALRLSYLDVARALLKFGADPTISDEDGNNAFHIAAMLDDERAVELLLDHVENAPCAVATPEPPWLAANNQGKVPVQLAASFEVQRLLAEVMIL